MPIMTESKMSAADEIAKQLTEAIHEHRLQPGAKLREDEICDIFGVSRTLVRQALRSLEFEGLLTIQKNRGAFVAKPSLKEAREVFQARSLIEPSIARMAAERSKSEDIQELEKHIKREHAALDQGEAGLALKLSGDFHLKIAEIADQETLEQFLRQLISRSSLVIALYWRRRNALCESNAHHDLITAIGERDADSAEEFMKSHLLDIYSQLDLQERDGGFTSLRDALRQ
ncbi:putative HTH-type transcriptional regulator YdfH [Pelagimonas phthalicica]|uniref:Putative HTH-type transcriptional regulator YdfH n=1 Tax=Pelagimonas phthalicica TaxID=1037362 RepID=A0A238JCM8_9RHOB|nr:GntR family transcriptional regulator [Pelagimonas phthalicica]SMX27722.1 putative HTH-type transcriptional regulator YdfH [Pelagimonas phthalicica]